MFVYIMDSEVVILRYFCKAEELTIKRDRKWHMARQAVGIDDFRRKEKKSARFSFTFWI